MDDDMEDYGFEYSDEEPEQEDVDIENQYYNSKGASKGPLSFETVTV
jgi:COP9 signalosome complex subunit 2